MKIQVIPDIGFDVDAVTQKFAWLGRTSSGKTFACKRFVEQLLRVEAQVVVVDTMGVWFGLRQGPKGFDIPVVGGLYGDIPLEPTAGILVAEVIVSSGSSMVLDVSQMTDGQRARFMEAFGRRLFELRKEHPAAMHIVLDEAQDVVPQNIQPNENMMLHEWVRIAKQGRALGLGLSFTSQRPQEINKKALNQTECVFAFQLTGAQERKALEYWLSDKGLDTKLSQDLPKLEVGVPFVWSPQWLKVARVMGRVLPIDSADTSQTPKLGEKSRRQMELKPIDLRALRQSMSEMVAKVSDSDPIVLRKRVKDLEAQLAGQQPEDTERLRELIELVRQRDQQHDGALSEAVACTQEMAAALDTLSSVSRRLSGILETCKLPLPPLALDALPKQKQRSARPAAHVRSPREALTERRAKPEPNNVSLDGLSTAESAIVRAAFQYGERGISVTTLAVTTGYRPGYIGNCIKALVARSAAPIERAGPSRVQITEAGKELVPRGTKPFPRGNKLVEHLVSILPEGESRVLGVAGRAYPKATTVDAIHDETNYAKGYIGNCIKALVARRALERVKPGEVKIHSEVYS